MEAVASCRHIVGDVARYDAVGTLVVSMQKGIVFEPLGLERVTQRAGYIGYTLCPAT